ncbi:cupin domain-containing protein, partial [Escherichia coli]|nr:cupin domain-containing protein [Escherichia coli]
MSEIPKIPRRVVTGIKDGKSVIAEDSIVTNINEDIKGLVLSDIWSTDTFPVDLEKTLVI